LTTPKGVTVTINNVERQPGGVGGQQRGGETVAENAANGTVVGITALGTDADVGATVTYSLSNDAGGRFAINASTGVITVANGTLLDAETATSHNVTVVATSSDGSTANATYAIGVTNDQ
jgi:hypothetical protein